MKNNSVLYSRRVMDRLLTKIQRNNLLRTVPYFFCSRCRKSYFTLLVVGE